MENDNYVNTAFLSYDKIGEEIDLQIELHPKIREIRFIKYKSMLLMYNSYYLLEEKNIPEVRYLNSINSASRKELADVVNNELNEDSLPQEIRLIRPNLERDIWSICLKR